MEENTEDVVSTQKTLQAVHDPGWNDPPSWAFSGSQKPQGTPTKRLLNKRVAFPLNSKSEATSGNASTQNMPPMVNLPPPAEIGSLTTAPHKPIVAPTAVSAGDSSSEIIEFNKEQGLKDVLENLKVVTDKIESSKAEEIQKRLDRMVTMYNEDKVNSAIHNKLLEISKALKEDDVERADQLHVSLLMNHATVCSSWIPGIRHLISELRSKKM